jgi:hypothetical protein
LVLITFVGIFSVIGIIPFADRLKNNIFNIFRKVKNND